MSLPSDGDHDDSDSDPADPGDAVSRELELVVVLDSSTIIELKSQVHTSKQWDLFDQMLELVRQGRLTFPDAVEREVANEKFPDMPGPWCSRAAKERHHHGPADATMAEILEFVQDLVDHNADPDREPADPYVAAMASELLDAGYDVAVATDDVKDRMPLKIALATACENLGITVWECGTFVDWVEQSRPGA